MTKRFVKGIMCQFQHVFVPTRVTVSVYFGVFRHFVLVLDPSDLFRAMAIFAKNLASQFTSAGFQPAGNQFRRR